jgi:hypothetical protein
VKVSTDKIKILRRGDPDFSFRVGKVSCPRAGFEISQLCPKNYKDLILEGIRNGWINPVAYMKESEHVWEKLGA